MNAWEELQGELEKDETIEAIVFGPFGWGSAPREGEKWEPGHNEPSPPPVPFEKRGVVLTPRQAKPLMQSWQFSGRYGAPSCYATYIWTDRRVFWVTQYDGATALDSMMRNPTACMPDMPGG